MELIIRELSTYGINTLRNIVKFTSLDKLKCKKTISASITLELITSLLS